MCSLQFEVSVRGERRKNIVLSRSPVYSLRTVLQEIIGRRQAKNSFIIDHDTNASCLVAGLRMTEASIQFAFMPFLSLLLVADQSSFWVVTKE